MLNASELNAQPDSIEYAGNMLDRHDHLDSQAPTLLEVTGISQHRMATASGLNDYDYQLASTLSLGLKPLNQIETINKVPIPSEVMEHFKHIKSHCMMGLFPEIGRAWLTIDSDIYIWTYEHARDVAYFDGLNQLIISVGLVKPKPGVFIADIKYLLILTTPIDIVVLGVTFNDNNQSTSMVNYASRSASPYEEMQLISKPIFVINTDNIAMTTIMGTDDYRIFVGGRDGCLYEIQYQAESNWFGKRCKKINHSQSLISYIVPGFLKIFSEPDSITKIAVDNSRNLLYTLTEKGAIEAWYLGTNCESTHRIARIAQNDIAMYSSNVLKTVDSSVFKPVVSICPLTVNDSVNLHLLAVTQCGVRLYFATVPLIQPAAQSNAPTPTIDAANKPQNLYLLHVRLPPGYTPNTTAAKPKCVHNAYYNKGTLLMVSTPQQDQNLLWSISSEPFPLRPYLAESTTIMPLNGQVWGIADIIEERGNEKITNLLNIAKNDMKVVLLTNQGAHIVALKKQVNLLQQLLLACHGAHHEAVKGYFQNQTEPQACATSVLLACMFNGTEIGIWATQAFLLYGGEPQFQSTNFIPDQTRHMNVSNTFFEQQPRGQMFVSTPLSTCRPGTALSPNTVQQNQFPMSIISNQSFGSQQPDMNNFGNLIYSSKHVGLYLHVSRLMRPIWKKRCVIVEGQSSISHVDCANILDDLFTVKSFIESLPINISGYGQTYGNATTLIGPATSVYGPFNQNATAQQKNMLELAYSEEKKSINALVSLIKHTCEVLSLWKILCEHQFHIIIQSLSKENQLILQSCTFRDLILDRTDICALLILSLINIYLNDNASVGSISSKLRDVCPNLYRHEDAVTHKATEILITSKSCIDSEEYNAKLHTALQLCKDAAPNLPLSNICQQFVTAKYHQGVIELCATCANKIDPNGAGLHFYKNKEPIADQEGYLAFSARMNCYKEIKMMLDDCYIKQTSQETTFGLINKPGGNNNENEQIMEIVSLALQTPDQLLHIAVYEWLLSHNLLSELLDISEPSLGEFLAHSVVKHPDNTQLADILWRYYERNGQHAEATKILDELASRQSNAIPLIQRIEYLARAVMCMRSDSIGYSAHNGVLLKNLEDKLEIARVQKLLLDALSSHTNTQSKEACVSLNFALYNITQLYTDFAERFDLWECKLTILNCSHHNDPKLIESVWTQILDEELQMPGSPYEKCSRMLSKVRALANEYGNSSHCFPISFLVRDLELRCCHLQLKQSPVPEALLSMKLDVDMLLDIYRRMISMNERIWASEGNEWHLVLSTTRLLGMLATQPNLIPTRNRRKNVSKPLDIISECRHLLYSKPDTKHMIEELDEIEIRLKRV